KAFQAMVTRYPDNALGYFKLGSFYGYRGNYDAALATFNKGLDNTPNNLALLKAASLAYYRKGDLTAAIIRMQKLTALDPKNDAELVYLATLYEESGDSVHAGEAYARVLADAPDNVVALNNYAVVLMRQNVPAKAIVFSQKAHELAPKNL